MTKQLLEDKYDLFIDAFEEEMSLFPNDETGEIIRRVSQKHSFDISDKDFIYHLVKRIYKSWVDMDDDYFDIVTCWTLGTYFFDAWVTYPYVFINAIKRSGKTRLLKLMSVLCNNCVYTMSLKEAVLFRLPAVKGTGLFIDETEQISGREKSDLRELLNAAYKRGVSVFRMRRNPQTEKFEPDQFEVFVPIATANIKGIDDVLADRCITLTMERSLNTQITDKVEMFELDPKVRLFKYMMYDKTSNLVSIVHDDITKTYTLYISLINTNYTNNIINTFNTTNTDIINDFRKAKITGRDLELWLPLFIVKEVFTEVYSDIISIASKYAEERRTTDVMEDYTSNIIVTLARFIQDKNAEEFFLLNDICHLYNQENEIDEKNKWAMKSRRLQNQLKKLKLINERRRVGQGVEVRLRFDKIKSWIKRMGIEITPVEEKQETLVEKEF